MRAFVYTDNNDGANNGGGKFRGLCIDGKVHLTISHSWMDHGDSGNSESITEVGPCDGSCLHPTVELDEKQESLVSNFMNNKAPYREITKSEFSYGNPPLD